MGTVATRCEPEECWAAGEPRGGVQAGHALLFNELGLFLLIYLRQLTLVLETKDL